VNGRNRDTYWTSILDGEWPTCKKVFEVWLANANFDERGTQRSSLSEVRQGVAESKVGVEMAIA